MDQNVVNMVQYLLVSDQKKIPIKKADIVRHIIPDNPRDFFEIFDLAKASLFNVFGLKVLETPDKNSYIIVTAIRDNSIWRPELTSQFDCTQGILIPILAVIFMNGGEAREENIWKVLSKMNLTPETKFPFNHVQTSLKDLLNSIWIRQMYLKKEDIGKSETKEVLFLWGFRAENEINKLELLKWVCEVYGDGYEPHMWKIQYQKALKHDEMLNPKKKSSNDAHGSTDDEEDD